MTCRSDRLRDGRSSIGVRALSGLMLAATSIAGAPVVAARQDQAAVATQALEPNAPVERELAAGQAHFYTVNIAAGQVLDVVVDQRGVDVSETTFGPDTKPILQTDSVSHDQGPESVFLIAPQTGPHRIEVRAPKAGSGRYEIRLAPMREATEQDRALAEAARVHAGFVGMAGTGRPEEALALAGQALALRKRLLGPDDPLVAQSLFEIGFFSVVFQRDDAKARPLFERALAIREKTLGPEHPYVAVSLHALAKLLVRRGEHEKAQSLIERSLAIRERTLGPEHPLLAALCLELGSACSDARAFTMAEPLLLRALAIRECLLGPEHLDVAATLIVLANLYGRWGKNAKREPLVLRALAIAEKAYGPEHEAVGDALYGVADYYVDVGDTPRADAMQRRGFAILEKALGPEHPKVVQAAWGLGRIAFLRNDLPRAIALNLRVLASREKAYGPGHRSTFVVLYDLGQLYSATGRLAEAESCLNRALAVAEKAAGPESNACANALKKLGQVSRLRGSYAGAEPLFRRALVAFEAILGRMTKDDVLERQKVVGSIAQLHHILGEAREAEREYLESIAFFDAALGPHSHTVSNYVVPLATLAWERGDVRQALEIFTRAEEVRESSLAHHLASGSEAQKVEFLSGCNLDDDRLVTLNTRSAPTDAVAARLALTVILRRKGRALDVMTDSIAALKRRASPADKVLLDELAQVRSRLASLVLGGQGAGGTAYRAEVDALETRAGQIEDDVSARSAELRLQKVPVTVESVQAAIPEDAALVEFLEYTPASASVKPWGSIWEAPRYVAYVLTRHGAPRWVNVGDAAAVDAAVARWRAALRDPKRNDVTDLARRLDSLVMQPVRSLLGPVRHLLVAPDGELNLVPFDALVDERGRYLIDDFSITYLTSGRDLLRLRERIGGSRSPLVVADPDFGGAPISSAGDRDITHGDDAEPDRPTFPRLTAVEGEASDVARLLPGAIVLTRARATETAVKQTVAPRVLHVATHGYFLEGQGAEDPLLRSGLALAGANLRGSGEDDGILTALEVAGLDLWGTKLVVLSACNTGVGEVHSGEGVYGLRRALVLAGSESQVMTLWPVSDRASRELMVGYYRRLLAGEGRTEGLREVQLEMRGNRNRSHPFFWAGFIQSGEWAPLEGAP